MRHLERQWWSSEEKERHKPLKSLIEVLKQQHATRSERFALFAELYEGRTVGSLDPAVWTALPGISEHDRPKLNGVRSCTATICSRIASQKPRAMFLTTDGTFAEQRKARGLERYVEGMGQKLGLYEEAVSCLYDCAIYGKGFLKFFVEDDELGCERILPDDVFVDEQTCRTGQRPRALYIRRMVSLDVLLAYYVEGEEDAEKKSAIEYALKAAPHVTSGEYETDLVEVWEGWHLRSSKKSKDGRHIVAVDGATLVDEEWTEAGFPIVELAWSKVTTGFWPAGLAEEVQGLQLEINDVLARMQEARHLLSAPYVLLPANAEVNLDDFTNTIARIMRYSGGVPPTVQVPQSIAQDVAAYLNNLWRWISEVAGVSQMSATSQKPAGDLSGRALQTLLDVESVRFSMLSRAWEQFQVRCAEWIVRLSKALYVGRSAKVSWSSKSLVRRIDWADVDMDEDRYVIRVYAANALPLEPAGRLAFVEQLRAAGGLSPEEVKDLLDYPDLERHMSLQRAGRDAVDSLLETMLDTGEMEPPLRHHDLRYGMVRCLQHWSRAKAQGAKDDEVSFLIDWLEAANALLEEQEHGRGTSGPAGQQPSPEGGPPPPPDAMMPPPGPEMMGAPPMAA